MTQIPVAVGMMVCDFVIVEENTRNVTPVNCWTHRYYRQYPTAPTTFYVVAFLTDGIGEMSLELLVESLDNWEHLLEMRREIRFEGPLQEYCCVFRVRDFPFPSSGQFEVSLAANGEQLARRKLTLSEKAP